MENRKDAINQELISKLHSVDQRSLKLQEDAAQLRAEIQLLRKAIPSYKKGGESNLLRFWNKYRISAIGFIFAFVSILTSVILLFCFPLSPKIGGSVFYFGLLILFILFTVQFSKYRAILISLTVALIPLYLSNYFISDITHSFDYSASALTIVALGLAINAFYSGETIEAKLNKMDENISKLTERSKPR